MKRPATEDVLAAGVIVFNLSISDIKQKTRKRTIVVPRQIVQYMCWRLQTDTQQEIAYKTGIVNHSTVLYSYREIGAQTAIYKDVADNVTKMENVLRSFGFDLGPEVQKGTMMPPTEPERRKRAFPVRITDNRTGHQIVAESIQEASRLTSINHTSIWCVCRGDYKKIMGHYKFEYHEQPESGQRA